MQTNKHTRFNTLSGITLILFPLILVISSSMALAGSSGSAAYLSVLGVALMIPAMVGMGIWCYRQAPLLALAGGILGIVGTAAGGIGWSYLDLFAAASGDPTLVEAIGAATGANIWLGLFGFLSPLGFTLLAVAAGRAGQPGWVTGLQILSMVLFIASWFTPTAVALAAHSAALVGFGWLGRQFLNTQGATNLVSAAG